jgi:hypothetical protein
MEDKDLLLVQHFFDENAQQHIADNGFTERIMGQLADTNSKWFIRLWNTACYLAFAVLFIVLDGWSMLLESLAALLHPLLVTPVSQQLCAIVAIAFGLMFVAAGEIYLRESTEKI